jgi:hypothetical protein
MSGAAIHSAAANAAQPSLIERFAEIATAGQQRFGETAMFLGGVEIGQDGNFNTYDGGGVLRLVTTAARPAIESWLGQLAMDEDLQAVCQAENQPLTEGAALFGLDIREILDHRLAVEQVIDEICASFADGAIDRVLDAPSWRCPEDHPDLEHLMTAFESVTEAPSADLVKLHGNDGGNLVAFRQAEGLSAAGEGPVVVFGQVGLRPHGKGELHRCTSIRPYLDILDRWAASLAKA